jgi:hypothetical protein
MARRKVLGLRVSTEERQKIIELLANLRAPPGQPPLPPSPVAADLPESERPLKRTRSQVSWENRLKRIERRYGLSEDDWWQMLHDQGYCCAVCNLLLEHPLTRSVVEHNHENGKNRGIAGYSCNIDVGVFERMNRVEARLPILQEYVETRGGFL